MQGRLLSRKEGGLTQGSLRYKTYSIKMAVEHNMLEAITQAVIDAAKAVIIAVREA